VNVPNTIDECYVEAPFREWLLMRDASTANRGKVNSRMGGHCNSVLCDHHRAATPTALGDTQTVPAYCLGIGAEVGSHGGVQLPIVKKDNQQ
jgi:hypothetical protein